MWKGLSRCSSSHSQGPNDPILISHVASASSLHKHLHYRRVCMCAVLCLVPTSEWLICFPYRRFVILWFNIIFLMIITVPNETAPMQVECQRRSWRRLMQGRGKEIEGERGKADRQIVEKELWQERTRPERRRPIRTEEEEVVRSGDTEEEERPEIPEDACVRLYVCEADKWSWAGERQRDREESRADAGRERRKEGCLSICNPVCNPQTWCSD